MEQRGDPRALFLENSFFHEWVKMVFEGSTSFDGLQVPKLDTAKAIFQGGLSAARRRVDSLFGDSWPVNDVDWDNHMEELEEDLHLLRRALPLDVIRTLVLEIELPNNGVDGNSSGSFNRDYFLAHSSFHRLADMTLSGSTSVNAMQISKLETAKLILKKGTDEARREIEKRLGHLEVLNEAEWGYHLGEVEKDIEWLRITMPLNLLRTVVAEL